MARSATDGIEADSGGAASSAQTAPSEPDPVKVAAARAELERLAVGGTSQTQPLVEAEKGTAAITPQDTASETSSFAEFVLYASGQDAFEMRLQDPVLEPRISAVLRDPAALDGERAQCAGTTPSVLIDIDPAGSAYSSEQRLTTRPEIIDGLAQLRAAEIDIAWISSASAAYAGDLRVALTSSGLDPEARDALLLMRYPGDRKQTRRNDLAAASCLIAIAGDERADFDELFGYLVNPEAALGLELLIGDGWFLVPSFIASDATSPTLAAKEEPTQ